MEKSTVDEIRGRFDGDVERFSNLDTGQVATIDAEISLELLTEAAKRIRPNASHILDLGCGAGNYTLKMLSKIPDLQCTLIDLSKPMLDRALERISKVSDGKIEIFQGDIREISLPNDHFDIILARQYCTICEGIWTGNMFSKNSWIL
jgi:tRNA (cmo5U34)-methyltransferase